MLLSLTLTNWRSHASSRLQFAAGTNLLLGQMGAGKSSVVDALCFALYGTYPKLQRRDAKLEDVPNFRHAGQATAAELVWKEDEGGKEYKIRREIGKKADAWLYCDGKLLQRGPKAVSEAVSEILKIDYDLFSRAVYSEQNMLDYWLSLPAGPRKAELDRLLGLDNFEIVRENCGKEITKLTAQAGAVEAQAGAQALADAQKKCADAKDEAEKMKGAADGAAKEAEGKKGAALEEERKFKLSEEKRVGFELAARKISGQAGKISLLGAQAAKFDGKKLSELEKDLERAKSKAAELEGRLKEARSALGNLRQMHGQLAAAQKDSVEKEARKKRIIGEIGGISEGKAADWWRKERENWKADEEKISRQCAGIEAELKSLEASYAALLAGGKEGGACPVCGSPLEGHAKEKLLLEKKQRSAELLAQLKNAVESRSKAAAQLKKAEGVLSQVEKMESVLSGIGEAKANLEGEIEKSNAELAKMQAEERALSLEQKKMANAAAELEKGISQQREAKKAADALLEARRALGMLEAEKKKIAFDEGAHKEASAARQAALSALAVAEERVKSCVKMAEQAAKMAEHAAAVEKDLRQRRESAEKMRKEVDELSAFRAAVQLTQAEVRGHLIEEINSALAKLWPVLYPYRDWRGIRILPGQKDYEIQIMQGGWKGLESFASGGERASVGLTLRVALSLLLTPQLGWLILDEPTHNLDAKAVQSLGQAMSEQLPKIIPQVLVITHDAMLLESTPGRVIRFERDKEGGQDSVVSVE